MDRCTSSSAISRREYTLGIRRLAIDDNTHTYTGVFGQGFYDPSPCQLVSLLVGSFIFDLALARTATQRINRLTSSCLSIF